jgi:ABC-type phosphonate transport system ATPase subunit
VQKRDGVGMLPRGPVDARRHERVVDVADAEDARLQVDPISLEAARIATSVEPLMMVADEPVSMVDASLRANILETLRNLQRDYGVSIINYSPDELDDDLRNAEKHSR